MDLLKEKILSLQMEEKKVTEEFDQDTARVQEVKEFFYKLLLIIKVTEKVKNSTLLPGRLLIS